MNEKTNDNFNRIYGPIVKYKNKLLQLYVLFNDYNTYTAYHIDPKIYYSLKNRNNIDICFDFKKSQFCNTFLDISTIKNDSSCCVNQFNGIYTQFKDILYYEDKETIILDKILISNKFIDNKIDINILRLHKFPTDFLYCICNRQYINDNRKKRYVKTSSFCIYSKECDNYLQQLFKKYKTTGTKFENTEDAIESLFSKNSDLTPQQLQNGFQL
jgi:hypothetical protein